MKQRCVKILFLGWVFLLANLALADEYGLRLGPAAVGNGGANPISIPPVNILDYELYYIDKDLWEIDISISPGLFFGFRAPITDSLYVAGGPGLVIDANGSGVVAFASIGYLFTCKFFCFGLEYKQAVGLASGGVVSPYAIRLSVGLNFD